jgi:hypothetical protein
LNDLSIAWVEGGSGLVFERPYYSQFIIIDSYDITIANQTLPTPREGIVIYGSQYVNVTNCNLTHGDVLSWSPDVRFSNCSIGSIGLSYTPAIIVDNDFFGSIIPRSTHINDLEVRRNNFFTRPLIGDEDSYYISFWDNYYSDYWSIYRDNSTTDDGVHWDRLYTAWGIRNSLARVYPYGYNGSRDPSIRSDRTPRTAFDGSNITFDVEAWDFIGIKNVSVRTSINGVNGTCELSRGKGYNWTGNFSLPIASTDQAYTIRAQSVTGHWANSSVRTVRVCDITPPALIDLTDPNGTTGDVFEFIANVTDNRMVSSVWVEYWWKDVPPLYLEMDRDGYYLADLALPSYRIDPIFYRIRAVDASENGVTSETMTIAVTDNDKPVPVLPLLVSTYIGRNVPLDASGSQDNIGIVRYRWDIKDVEGTVRIEGSRVNYVFKFAGTFMVILMVQDAAGNAGWTVIYANVSEYPIRPQPGPPDKANIYMTFGRVTDSGSHLPIEGVRVLLLMEGMYYLNSTDRFGYCSLLIPEPSGYIEGTITLRKEGYRNLTYGSIISPEGYLRDIDPEMERSEVDPPEIPVAPPMEREHDMGVPWLLVLLAFDMVLAILAVGLWTFLRRGSKKGGAV